MTSIDARPDDTPAAIRRKVAAVPRDPVRAMFDALRFARLLRGRLLFYAERIPWFDSAWLIRNEAGRLVTSFFEKPLTAYGAFRWGASLPPEQVRRRLRGGVLTTAQVDGMIRFTKLARRPIVRGKERDRARQRGDQFDVALATIETLWTEVVTRTAACAGRNDHTFCPAPIRHG